MASTLGLLLLFVCYCAASSVVRPTKMWRFLGENEEPVLQKFRETLDEFSVGTIKCLRWVFSMTKNVCVCVFLMSLFWQILYRD